MESALNASMERRAMLGIQQTRQRDLRILGTNLERLMVKLAADVEAIAEEVDGRQQHTVQELAVFVDGMYDTKLAVLKAFSEWLKLGGDTVDPAVGGTVSKLELAVTRLSDRLEDRIRSEPLNNDDSQTKTAAKAQTVQTEVGKGAGKRVGPRTLSKVVRPKTRRDKVVRTEEETQVNTSDYFKRLVAAAPESVGREG